MTKSKLNVSSNNFANIEVAPAASGFGRDEETQKCFYLEWACSFKPDNVKTESELLVSLYQRMKRFTKLLGVLCGHPFIKSYSQIQMAAGYYLMDSATPKASKTHLNQLMAQQASFTYKLLNDKYLILDWQEFYLYHLKKLESLIEKTEIAKDECFIENKNTLYDNK